MMHHPLRRTAAALLGVGLALVGGLVATSSAGAAPEPEPVRVMALGDSITGSPGCWRALLHRDLTAAGHAVDMVGTQAPQGCGIAHDGDHEGHGGALVTDVAASGEARAWFAATRPQVVLMHFATNDVWSNRTTGEILAAWETLIEQMRAVDPHVVVLVAQIVPVAPPSCADCPARTAALNAAVPDWALETSTRTSSVGVVDHGLGWDPALHTTDGVHPNDAGTQRMAATWLPAVEDALDLVAHGDGPPPSQDPTVTPADVDGPPTPDPSTTPPVFSMDPLGCEAALTVTSRWDGGFVASVKVRNLSMFYATTTWVVTVDLPAGRVGNAWNATPGGTSPATFTPAPWSPVVGLTGSAEFGFQASGSPDGAVLTCAWPDGP